MFDSKWQLFFILGNATTPIPFKGLAPEFTLKKREKVSTKLLFSRNKKFFMLELKRKKGKAQSCKSARYKKPAR